MIKLSYSSICNYLQCPRKFKEVNVDYRFKSSNVYSEKGSDVHKQIEEYIKGISDTNPMPFTHKVIESARTLYKATGGDPAVIGVENQFAVDSEGNHVPYKDKNAILRGKIDLYIQFKDHLAVIDWKTGKRRDNRMQSVAYDILTRDLNGGNNKKYFIFDYLQDGADPKIELQKTESDNFWKTINAIQQATEFPEKPGPLCPWCPVPKAFCKFKQE